MPDMMGDAGVDSPTSREAPHHHHHNSMHHHQDPLDLSMTVKDPGITGLKDEGYPRDPGGKAGGNSPDSSRRLSPEPLGLPSHCDSTPLTLVPNRVYVPDGKQPPYPSLKGSPLPHPPLPLPPSVPPMMCDSGSVGEEPSSNNNNRESGDSRESPHNGSADRPAGAPAMRPFKMYQHMDPLMYGSMLGSPVGSMGSPGGLANVAGLSALYDSPPHTSPSPGGSAFGLGVTPMVSYMMQKRRRHEAREKENKDRDRPADQPQGTSSSSSSKSPPATATSASASASSSAAMASLTADELSDESDPKKLKVVPDEKKDEAYWERRRKNNEAAKRSRDARRQKEEEIAMRAAFLEQENLKLRAQVAILKNETAKLHYLLYNRV